MDIHEPIAKLRAYAESRNYSGYDPYDALNSPLAPLLSLGTRWGRVALTQFGRRSPINCRHLLLIRPGVNPKALGLFLEGYAKLFACAPSVDLSDRMADVMAQLEQIRSPGISGAGWGYHFPWQNRKQCLPRYTPTIVNSSFIGHALLDYHEATGRAEPLALAGRIPDFFLNDLKRKAEGDTFCFSYTPRDTNFVHNANMLGASLLARLAVRYNRGELLTPALQALAYSMNHQHEDGSWFYAETDFQKWIDSFHTGFNLEALRRFLDLGLTPQYRDAYETGIRFYAGNFFLRDGTPRYYHDRLYLVDIHAPAEAICFFAGAGDEYRALTERVMHWTLENMYDTERGIFYFRKAPRFTIRIPYMRWSEAWAFRALTEYFRRNFNGDMS